MPDTIHRLRLTPLFGCIILSLALLLVSGCSTQTRKSAPCVYQHPDEGVITAENCIFRDETGRITISEKHFRNLQFGKDGLAVVRGESEGWMYVGRKGQVVVSDVPTMDNWADDFNDGLVRVHRGNKWGFADKTGQMIIPLLYDCAMGFENGIASVCEGCKYEYEPQGEFRWMCKGGKWKQIDTTGRELKSKQ